MTFLGFPQVFHKRCGLKITLYIWSFSTLFTPGCYKKKYFFFSPQASLFIISTIKQNRSFYETNIPTKQQEEKEQARLQIKNGINRWPACPFKKKTKRKKIAFSIKIFFNLLNIFIVCVRNLCVFTIILYKKCISPLLGYNCRFYPSCSSYAITTLKEKKFFCAFGLIVVRLFKCSPLHPGGIDTL